MSIHESTGDGRTRIAADIVDVIVLMPVASPAGHPFRVLTMRRAAGVRCTGAWEIVHGRIERDEMPAAAACREVLEETGLPVARLYSLTVNPFYLHLTNTLHMAIGFVAIVTADALVRLSVEHDAFAWTDADDAIATLAWPRSRDAVRQAMSILRTGDAGATEDVLRII